MHRSRRIKVEWPAWRFGPDGESQMFDDPKDVPDGWVDTPPILYEPVEPVCQVCEVTITKKLKKLGVTVDPTWGNAKLQEVLKELTND